MNGPQRFGDPLSLSQPSPTRAVSAVKNTVPCDGHLSPQVTTSSAARARLISKQPVACLGLPLGLAAGLKRLKLKLELPSFGFDAVQSLEAGISSRWVVTLFKCDALTDGLGGGFGEGRNARLELLGGEWAGFVGV